VASKSIPSTSKGSKWNGKKLSIQVCLLVMAT
jgi:hypothetical protein